MIDIRDIAAEDTLEMRVRILRPGFAGDDLRFPGDDDADTLHAGAYADERLVGITSIYRATSPHDPAAADQQWQVRGVAVDSGWRRRGVARLLMQRVERHAIERAAKLIWCNARIEAIPLYESLGYVEHGAVFEIQNVGPHVVMWRRP